ncbi:MAG: sigma-70 family RNA polymerase sigma factor [Phycisphaeraceae bacterium]|nr:sigma-70 family RNA polymerase sigma factor [Phycisphaeraceae bacterium]
MLADLVARAVAGDESAFEALHRRIGPGLRRMLAQRLPNGADAEIDDLSQRVWIAIWQALRSGAYQPERAAFTTFAYAIAYRTFLYHARQNAVHRSRMADFDFGDAAAGPQGQSPESAQHLAALLETLRGVLRGESAEPMSSDDRAMLRAIAEGESDRSLAARLALSPSTANARKQAALGKVRRLLARLGFSPDSAEREKP